MDHIFFDSFDTAFRSPAGAVRAETPVTLTLATPADYGYLQPRLVLHRDGGEQEQIVMNFTHNENGVNYFSTVFTPYEPGLYFYHFDLYSDFRKIYRGNLGKGVLTWESGEEWQITAYERDFTTPDCYKGGVQYQIFPDRFYEGKVKPMPFTNRVYRTNKHGEPYFWPNENGGSLNLDYYGGDFAGIQEKLPYLQEMGVTYIYLNPIFEAHSNHRYNTADYMNVDPLLGTNEDFTALCKAAEQVGIRIILDGVFSHTGSDSIYFNREGRYGSGGAYHDKFSPYRSWYEFSPKYKCGYRSWWGFDTLPEVDEDNPGYRNFICGKGGVIDTWLSRGASGFRLDVADELPDDFIEEIRKAVKAHGSDKLLLGEVWEDATTKVAYEQRRTYLLGLGLDCVMNYPFRNAVLDFIKGKDTAEVADCIMSICENYPKPALDTLMNFLSTHDTERAITSLAGPSMEGHDRYWQSGRKLSAMAYEQGIKWLIMAYALIYTLPGVPSVYYGDEIGMQGYKDPFNRAYFNWESHENRVRPVLKNLAELRKTCDAFYDGKMEMVKAEGDILHFRRVGKTQTAEMIFNRGGSLVAVEAFGKYAEVNPRGFSILVEDNEQALPGYFKIR